ncbi:MAG: hypothetical protein GXO56_01540 [Chloroflexi bacterium]|nr:hypothetical protein [Chloroflexota bacterium]
MTKKILMALFVFIVATGATATAAFARGGYPPARPETLPTDIEPGTGVLSLNLDINASDFLNTYLATAAADLTGLTADELQARLDAGESLSDILLSLGYDATEVPTMVQDLREQAIWLAVDAGLLTADEATFLLEQGQAQTQNQHGYRYSDSTDTCTTVDGITECVPVAPQDGTGFGADATHGHFGRGGH